MLCVDTGDMLVSNSHTVNTGRGLNRLKEWIKFKEINSSRDNCNFVSWFKIFVKCRVEKEIFHIVILSGFSACEFDMCQ